MKKTTPLDDPTKTSILNLTSENEIWKFKKEIIFMKISQQRTISFQDALQRTTLRRYTLCFQFHDYPSFPIETFPSLA